MVNDPSQRNRDYWKKNLQIVVSLLTVWFLVSFGCSILWVDQLDQIQVGHVKLGFWFAQQGSIYTFVILIFIYVRWMNRIEDRAFEQPADRSEGGAA